MNNNNQRVRVYYTDGEFSNIMIKHLEGHIFEMSNYVDLDKTLKAIENFKANRDAYNITLNRLYNKLTSKENKENKNEIDSEFNQDVINELEKSNLYPSFINEIITEKGKTDEYTYYGKYKGFYLFESEVDEDSFALNNKYYSKEGFNIYSYDGIEEVINYINEIEEI